jgi:hypothetical protein
MTSRAFVTLAGAWVLAGLALGACADFERGPAATTPDAAAGDAAAGDAAASDGAALSFATNVLPLLQPCTRCHVAGQEAGDTHLLFTGSAPADYSAVVTFVDTSTPTASRLLVKMRGESHEGGTIYAADTPEYQTVLNWIQQGARP